METKIFKGIDSVTTTMLTHSSFSDRIAERLLELIRADELRLTNVLLEPEPYRTAAMAVLTGQKIVDGPEPNGQVFQYDASIAAEIFNWRCPLASTDGTTQKIKVGLKPNVVNTGRRKHLPEGFTNETVEKALDPSWTSDIFIEIPAKGFAAAPAPHAAIALNNSGLGLVPRIRGRATAAVLNSANQVLVPEIPGSLYARVVELGGPFEEEARRMFPGYAGSKAAKK